MELIHRHLCERDIFKHQSRVISNYQINSLENLASKQKLSGFLKSNTASCKTVRSKDCSAKLEALQSNLNIAPV